MWMVCGSWDTHTHTHFVGLIRRMNGFTECFCISAALTKLLSWTKAGKGKKKRSWRIKLGGLNLSVKSSKQKRETFNLNELLGLPVTIASLTCILTLCRLWCAFSTASHTTACKKKVVRARGTWFMILGQLEKKELPATHTTCMQPKWCGAATFTNSLFKRLTDTLSQSYREMPTFSMLTSRGSSSHSDTDKEREERKESIYYSSTSLSSYFLTSVIALKREYHRDISCLWPKTHHCSLPWEHITQASQAASVNHGHHTTGANLSGDVRSPDRWQLLHESCHHLLAWLPSPHVRYLLGVT